MPAQTIRNKILEPRVLATEKVTVSHPEGDVNVIVTELPYAYYKQFKAAADKQPELTDELRVIHSTIDAENQLIFTPTDIAAFDELPSSVIVPLIEAAKKLNT